MNLASDMSSNTRGPEGATRARIVELIREKGPARPVGIETATGGEISQRLARKIMKKAVEYGELYELELAAGTYDIPKGS